MPVQVNVEVLAGNHVNVRRTLFDPELDGVNVSEEDVDRLISEFEKGLSRRRAHARQAQVAEVEAQAAEETTGPAKTSDNSLPKTDATVADAAVAEEEGSSPERR